MKSVSLIGAGKNALEHTRALKSLKNLEILGVCAKNLNSADNFKFMNNITYATNDIEDLFKKTKSDYLVISVPIDQTLKVLETASKFPWKILVEKPLGLNLEEALQINTFLENRNPNTFVALNRRFYKIYKHLKDVISLKNNKIELEIFDFQSIKHANKFNHSSEVIKNWQFANSIHLIDLGLFFANSKVDKIIKDHKIDKKNFIINSTIFLENESIIKYCADWNNDGTWKIRLTSNEYQIVINPLEKIVINYKDSSYSLSEFDFSPFNLYKPGYLNQALYFTEINNDSDFKLVNFKQSLSTMELISKIYEF